MLRQLSRLPCLVQKRCFAAAAKVIIFHFPTIFAMTLMRRDTFSQFNNYLFSSRFFFFSLFRKKTGEVFILSIFQLAVGDTVTYTDPKAVFHKFIYNHKNVNHNTNQGAYAENVAAWAKENQVGNLSFSQFFFDEKNFCFPFGQKKCVFKNVFFFVASFCSFVLEVCFLRHRA